jgi:hypothetical protein
MNISDAIKIKDPFAPKETEITEVKVSNTYWTSAKIHDCYLKALEDLQAEEDARFMEIICSVFSGEMGYYDNSPGEALYSMGLES